MEPVFSPVDLETWPRKPYFDYFYYGVKTKYNINHNLDITTLIEEIRERELKFYPVMLYVIMKTVNQHEAFRYSFDENGYPHCPGLVLRVSVRIRILSHRCCSRLFGLGNIIQRRRR